ncbi:hypothetical protein HDU83_004625 [Entophlyctis luteolus]|nr:hypothetical protein HDU83_004625 [Entophlyctis luteolus]
MPASTVADAPPNADAAVASSDPAALPDAFPASSSVLDWMAQALAAPHADTDASAPSAAVMPPMPAWQTAGFLWPMQLLQAQATSAASNAAVALSPTSSALAAQQQLAAMQSFASVAGLQRAVASFQTIASSLSDASLRAAVVAQIPALQGFQTSMQAQINQMQQAAAARGADASVADSLNAVISQLQTGGSAWIPVPPAAAATASWWEASGFFPHLQQLQAACDAAADAGAALAVSRQMQAIAALNSLAGLQQAVRAMQAVEAAVDAALRRVLSMYILVLQGFTTAFAAQVQILQQGIVAVSDSAVVSAVSSRIATLQFGATAMQDWNQGGVWMPERRDNSCSYCCWDGEYHGEHSRRDAHHDGGYYGGDGYYGYHDV